MNTDLTHYPAPPRLLLGTAILVWGGLTNHALSALGIAFLIEACHWVSWRWDFKDKGYSRAWILSLIILAATVGFHSLNHAGTAAMLAFVEWMPIIFLPLILTQQYGEERTVPTSIFSFFARRRMKRERLLGKIVRESRIHLGYPYLVLTLLATGHQSTGQRAQWIFLTAVLILSGVAFFFGHQKEQRRLIPWFIVLTIVSLVATGSSHGLILLYFWVKDQAMRSGEPQREAYTAIGHLGELKLSNRIHWRVQVSSKQTAPKLMMTQSYNRYHKGRWKPVDSNIANYERSFTELLTLADKAEKGEFSFDTNGFKINETVTHSVRPIRVRGSVRSNRKALPCPSSPGLFSHAEEIDTIEHHQLGTILAINASNVIDFKIWPGNNPSLRESNPTQEVRNGMVYEVNALALPRHQDSLLQEAKTLKKIAEQLQLSTLSDREKITRLAEFFDQNFSYSTHLKIPHSVQSGALVEFLTNTQEGHCEYFATATCLLLRAAGIPTRYAVGYAVMETASRPTEYLLRGSHAHAWCRAYLRGEKKIITEEHIQVKNGIETPVTIEREIWEGGQWVDIDLTPSSWTSMDISKLNIQDQISDFLQRLREDFQLWRANERNRGWVNAVLFLTAIFVLIFIIWRLSGTRLRKNKPSPSLTLFTNPCPTAFNSALKEFETIVGPRPLSWTPQKWFEHLDFHFQLKETARLIKLHEQSRFNEGQLSPKEEKEFRTLIRAFTKSYSQGTNS